LSSDPTTEFEAIEFRKCQIKDDQVRACFSHRSQTCLPVMGSNHLEAFRFEALSEEIHDALFVFDNQDLRMHSVAKKQEECHTANGGGAPVPRKKVNYWLTVVYQVNPSKSWS